MRRFYSDSFPRMVEPEVSQEGLDSLARFTGGLPVLAHEIGDAVWRTARGPTIEKNEISEGISTAAEGHRAKTAKPPDIQCHPQ